MKAKEIIQYSRDGDFIKIWPSISNIQETLELRSHTNISSCCNKKSIPHNLGFEFYPSSY